MRSSYIPTGHPLLFINIDSRVDTPYTSYYRNSFASVSAEIYLGTNGTFTQSDKAMRRFTALLPVHCLWLNVKITSAMKYHRMGVLSQQIKKLQNEIDGILENM